LPDDWRLTTGATLCILLQQAVPTNNFEALQ
jgi:hypothetical protein